MGIHSNALRQLAQQVFSIAEQRQLLSILSTTPFPLEEMIGLDLSLGGPSMARMNCNNSGRYHVNDRAVFRPLQYCGSYLEMADGANEIVWLTREIVHMSGLHLETTLKRVGQTNMPWPLGELLYNRTVKSKVDAIIRGQIGQFLHVYNASKHDVDQPKDTHLFSLEDAIIVYAISRRIGVQLYPLTKLYTKIAIFETDCPA